MARSADPETRGKRPHAPKGFGQKYIARAKAAEKKEARRAKVEAMVKAKEDRAAARLARKAQAALKKRARSGGGNSSAKKRRTGPSLPANGGQAAAELPGFVVPLSEAEMADLKKKADKYYEAQMAKCDAQLAAANGNSATDSTE